MGAEKRKRKEKNGIRILEREVERGGYNEESKEREVEEGGENITLKRKERGSREMRMKGERGKLHDKKRVEDRKKGVRREQWREDHRDWK